MIVAFSGHRPPKLMAPAMRDAIFAAILAELDRLRPSHAISGMALGVDQWAAWACVTRGIPFTAAVPFRGQESRWSPSAQKEYADLLARAAFVKVIEDDEELMVSAGHHVFAYQVRNMWMVKNCDHLIAVYDGEPNGGTADTVRYAEALDKPMTIIDPGGIFQ